MRRSRRREAALRFEERQKRENEAPRLKDELPRLATLRLEIEEYVEGNKAPVVRHTRHIVVQRAPALFHFLCGDADCEDGGHEITHQVLFRLGEGVEEFGGDHRCGGRQRNGSNCPRTLHYGARASYVE